MICAVGVVLLSNGGPRYRSCWNSLFPAAPVAMYPTGHLNGYELRLLVTAPFFISLQVRVLFPCVFSTNVLIKFDIDFKIISYIST